ncbi:hypothetical protein EAE99_002609 [Botrytis elliptica]|nr:hypothetical protein EAE99_002609 [Botrytis elliptica]
MELETDSERDGGGGDLEIDIQEYAEDIGCSRKILKKTNVQAMKSATVIIKIPRAKNYHRDRPDRERPLPRRVIIPQDVSDKLTSPTILPSVKVNFSASRNVEMVAWEALQEAVRVQARAVAAYQNTVSNFKLVWEEVRSEGAIVKPATA